MRPAPLPLADALAWLARKLPLPAAEPVPLAQACGRVLAEAVGGADAQAGAAVAAIDGLAVAAAATDGASEYAPLPVRGAAVASGAELPPWADAVLPPALFTPALFAPGLVSPDLFAPGLSGAGMAALGTVAPGHGVVPAGGAASVAAATMLRPLHLALLARLGCTAPRVRRQARVAVRVAGAKSGADALTPMLAALLAEAGAQPVAAGERPDLHLHAGRSGPGPDDDGIAGFDDVVAHGLAVQPGETTALGMIGGRPAILLPGDPLACATMFALLVAPLLRQAAGAAAAAPDRVRLAGKIVSGIGLLQAVPVRLRDGQAYPLGGADAVSLAEAAGADGLALVPEGSEGYPEGAMIPILLLP